jgi:predicted DsbA family dithiol-disulfide isomerase
VFQYGKAQGLGEELLERLFLAYFTECRDMADSETLAELAAGVGLDRAAALAAAESEYGDPWDEAVGKDHVRGQMLGAAGVPFALVNAKYRISGAQSADIFAEALREVVRRDFGPDASR